MYGQSMMVMDRDEEAEETGDGKAKSLNGLGNNCPVMMKLPSKLRDRLLPFQKEGVRFAEKKNGRCLIADEMGLGKTIQAISVAYIYKDEWPLLIIVPSSLKFCWIEELEKWLPDILPHEINLVQSGSDVSGMAVCPITIVTYGLLRLPSSKVIREALSARRFQVVICDESHYLKNISTSSCKTVIPILKMANRRLLLSGTPALAKPVELYPQIDAICPGKFGSFWQYTDKYCDAHNVYFGKFRKRQVNGASHLEDLQQKLKSMMIRREKSDVLTELPPKQRQKIMFELKHSSLKKDIFDTFAELKQRMQKGDKTVQKVMHSEDLNMDMGLNVPDVESPSNDRTAVGVYSLISRLYKLTGEAKIGPVREYIEMLCEDDQLKFLVFAYHHDMMDGIQQTLWEKKVKFVRIDGSTRSSDRQMFVNQFQSDPETRVAILSILAAGVGLTLTAAKLVIFSELYWTPGVMVQCEDRAHRIGQTCSLPVHYLVARDTMDEWVWSALCRKTLVTSTALTGKTKHLDHGEGSSSQIELLSNADMWKLEDGNTDADVDELVQSQRAGDQSSILEFFSSQRSPECTPTLKRKHLMVSPKARSSVPINKSDPSLNDLPCQDYTKEMPDFKKKKPSSDSEFIVISEDENDFKPTRKKKKREHRKVSNKKQKECTKMKKIKQRESRTVKNKPFDKNVKCTSLGLTDFEGSPTFDLNFCDDSESSLTEVDCDGSSLLKEMSFNVDEEKIHLEKGLWGNKPLKDECNEKCLLSSEVSDMRTLKDESNEKGLLSSEVSDMRTLKDESNEKCLLSSEVSDMRTLKDEKCLCSNEVSDMRTLKDESNGKGLCSSEVSDLRTLKDESNGKGLCSSEVSDMRTLKDESNEKCLCSCDIRNMRTESNCMKDADKHHKRVFSCNSERCVSSESAPDHLQDSCNVSFEAPQGHSCLTDLKEQQQKQTRSDQWSCSICTFFNHPEISQCELCDTPKKKSTSIQHKKKLSHSENDSHRKIPQIENLSHTTKDSSLLTKSSRKKHCPDPTDSPSQRNQSICSPFTTLKAENTSQNCAALDSSSQILRDVSRRKRNTDSIVPDNCISDSDIVSSQDGLKLLSQCQSSSQPSQCQSSSQPSQYQSSSQPSQCQSSSQPSQYQSSSQPSQYQSSSQPSQCQSSSQPSQCQSSSQPSQCQSSSQPSQCQSSSQPRSLFPSTMTEAATGDSLSETHVSDFDEPEKTLMTVQSHVVEYCEQDLEKLTSATFCVANQDVFPAQHSTALPSTPTVVSAMSSEESCSGLDFQPSINRRVNSKDHRSTTPANCTDLNHEPCTQQNSVSSDRRTHSILKFSCSIHTGRIYVYDENEHFLQASFHPIDIEMGNTDELPEMLHQPHNLRLLYKFVREWSSLTDTKKRVIAKRCQVFTSPHLAYEAVKTVHGSKQRHLSKQDTLANALKSVATFKGSIQVISKHATPAHLDAECADQSATSVRGMVQGVTKDGVPLCLQCQTPFSSPLLSHQTISSPENAWQLRLCSFSCMDQYWTLSRAGYCRDQVYDLQRGVCQLCGFDAHSLFIQVRVTKSLKARTDLIGSSPYRSLTSTQKKKMVEHPQAGQFWHVDHITPVWQGGGLCDLDNMRTLCTPCHLKVTRRQAGQRATMKKLSGAAGQADITAFFQRS